MAVFIIPVTWEVYSTIEVEADSLEEAIEEADPKSFVSISENVHTIGKFDDFGL